MTYRKVDVFFYGLFMDMGILQERGLVPIHPQIAYLDGYDLENRDRATREQQVRLKKLGLEIAFAT